MMTGKAVARALRGHFLVESALFALLLESMLKLEFLTTSDIDDLRNLYKGHRAGNKEIVIFRCFCCFSVCFFYCMLKLEIIYGFICMLFNMCILNSM